MNLQAIGADGEGALRLLTAASGAFIGSEASQPTK